MNLLGRVALPCLTFGLGVAVALSATSLAQPAEAPPAATAPAPPTALVLPIEATALRVAPNGQATVRMLPSGRNAFLGLLRLEAGAAVPEHRDASEELIHVLEGTARMTIDGQTHDVGPGTTIYMPANAQVSVQNGDAPLVGLQVFAGPESAAKYQAWRPMGAANPARPGPPRGETPRTAPPPRGR